MFFNIKLNFLSRLQLMEKRFWLLFLNQTFFTMLLIWWLLKYHNTQKAIAEPQNPPWWKRPSGCCSETAKKKQTKKPQRVQFGFCVLWRLKLLKKKRRKKAPQCSKNSLVASPLFEHKTEISLVFLIILVARCYCRFKDLFLDGRSGG